MANIMKVVAEPLFKTRVSAPSVNLRIARESTSNGVPLVVIRIFFGKFEGELGALGPRPHKTHITAQDVPELRKLVQAGTAEVVTNAGASRIARYRPNRPEIALRLFTHGSEFENRKPPALQPDPCLTVKNGPAIGHPDC